LYNSVKNEQAYDSKLFQIHITEMKQRQALNLMSAQRFKHSFLNYWRNSMSYLDTEEESYSPRFREPQPLQLSLASAPTTLAMLGMNLAKSMGFSPMLGGVQAQLWVG
jgi:hypothetical protein